MAQVPPWLLVLLAHEQEAIHQQTECLRGADLCQVTDGEEASAMPPQLPDAIIN